MFFGPSDGDLRISVKFVALNSVRNGESAFLFSMSIVLFLGQTLIFSLALLLR